LPLSSFALPAPAPLHIQHVQREREREMEGEREGERKRERYGKIRNETSKQDATQTVHGRDNA